MGTPRASPYLSHTSLQRVRAVFFRSSSKPIQALPVIARGLDKKYGLTDEETAIFSGSHQGDTFHVAALKSIYEKAGLTPLSPVQVQRGVAAADGGRCRLLTSREYLDRRDAVAAPLHCRPTPAFLSLYEGEGGFAETEGALALYERRGEDILFKEYRGDPVFAPRLAAFLGGARYELRRYHAGGTPFGMGAGVAYEAEFLAALD